MPLRAVVFDMDGVLVDSEPLWHRAEIAAFAEVGLSLTATDCLRTTGLRVDAVARYWFEHARLPGAPEPVAEDIVRRVQDLLREEAEPKPGAVAAVRAAAAEYPVALASSSSDALIAAVLHRLGLADAFRVVRSAEHEPLGKPDPGVYLTAARLLGVAPTDCLAIEDSGTGIRSALAAGMRVLAVPDVPVAPEVLARAHAVVPSLVDWEGALRGLRW